MGVFAVILQQLNCSLGHVYVSHAQTSSVSQLVYCHASCCNPLMLCVSLLEPVRMQGLLVPREKEVLPKKVVGLLSKYKYVSIAALQGASALHSFSALNVQCIACHIGAEFLF